MSSQQLRKARIVIFLLSLCILSCPATGLDTKPINPLLAFYYGNNPPLQQLKLYDNIVVEPSSGIDPKLLQTDYRQLYAYASLGEAISLNQYKTPINKQWVIGKNEHWNTLVLDQTNKAWQQYFLDELITPLWNKGYRGFFLDTLDSYQLATRDPLQMKKQQAGMILIINAIKTKYPKAKIILNRGFDLLPEIKSLVGGVVAESLFRGWNNQQKKYYEISKQDRDYLLQQLKKVQEMGLPVTVVDYVAPADKQQAYDIAKKIAGLGFNPWVTDNALTKLYLFDFNIQPRKILMLYQGKRNNIDEKVGSYMSKEVSMPLNYLGYVTELRNIEEPLPENISKNEYAGIVVAIDGFLLGHESQLIAWYQTQIKNNIPLVILNNFGFPLDNIVLNEFGLAKPLFEYAPHTLKILYQAPIIGYEVQPVLHKEDFIPIRATQGTSLLQVVDETGTKADLAAYTPWGGYYVTNNFLVRTIDNHYRWSINPFEFFKKALHLPDMPIPDTTTENGRRLMFVHIDGDGFANRAAGYHAPFVGEIMREQFLEHYAIPATVSIIQGEIAANGINPTLSNHLEQLAREIFALPNVEIASHTFSHPFNWMKAAAFEYTKKGQTNPYTLPIPDYQFNLAAEVTGSVDYINSRLAPPGKKCKVFLWSGEGDVPQEALKLSYQMGLANLNPGTLITKLNNSKSRVSSLGIFEGPDFQVFAPIGNDNETIAHDPYFYSLIDTIHAFQLTDKPQRLKPIDIYIHFYTVSQQGGITALHLVFKWALSQPIMNIFASDYFNKVIDFNQLIIVKKDGGLWFETNDHLRELRVPQKMGYPDLKHSINVIGFSSHDDDYYVHLGPGGEAFLMLTQHYPTVPYLIDANARVTHYSRTAKGVDFSLRGYLPPTFSFGNMSHCGLWLGDQQLEPQLQQDQQKSYVLQKGTEYDFSIRCK